MGYGMYIPHRMVREPFIKTEQRSNKIFALAYTHPTPATNITKLEHRVRYPVHTVNMVPVLANQSLLSGGKFAKNGMCLYVIETRSIFIMVTM